MSSCSNDGQEGEHARGEKGRGTSDVVHVRVSEESKETSLYDKRGLLILADPIATRHAHGERRRERAHARANE